MAAARRGLVGLLATAAAASLLSLRCLAYNQECAPFVPNPDTVTGFLDQDVKTTKPEVRTKNNAIGQLVAEAYYRAFDREPLKDRPDLGLENAGAIRAEGICELREVLKKGPVKRKHLREVLPFDDTIVNVKVTHRQLKGILEHAVAAFIASGQANPSGAFLQIHGGEVDVDCSQQAETIRSDGTRDREGKRVTRISIGRRDGSRVEVPLNPPSDTATVRVAINSFLLKGGDNFVDFRAVGADSSDNLSAGTFNFEAVASHFLASYPSSAPLSGKAAARVNLSATCK
jgi:2',3'-cyclic-nucleotide 2'-phosphodiesterase (5'-nucleotidase family)